MNSKMIESVGDVYIKVHSLGPDTLFRTAEGHVVDWESDRGWFDELVPTYRRRAADLERVWTEDQQADNSDEGDLSDSYFGYDLSEWRNIQQERKQSIILGLEKYDYLDAQLPVILAIE
jgi:casein kinase I family protein HRR25